MLDRLVYLASLLDQKHQEDLGHLLVPEVQEGPWEPLGPAGPCLPREPLRPGGPGRPLLPLLHLGPLRNIVFRMERSSSFRIKVIGDD